jgi:hypothetical protein
MLYDNAKYNILTAEVDPQFLHYVRKHLILSPQLFLHGLNFHENLV